MDSLEWVSKWMKSIEIECWPVPFEGGRELRNEILMGRDCGRKLCLLRRMRNLEDSDSGLRFIR